VLTGLLASVRELRNPLTVGYSTLFAVWVLAGDHIEKVARQDELGRRILLALDSMGDGAELALYTFLAAMLGSLLWNALVARLVGWLAKAADHPDWDSLIEEASAAVRRYEEHDVLTYKGFRKTPSSFDATHTVPSPQHALYLRTRVDERERKAAEMSFRTTLAISLVPVALAVGIDGGGNWWWFTCAVPVVWLDVALLKHTTLRTVRRFELEDLKSRLEKATTQLSQAQANANTLTGDDLARVRTQITRAEKEIGNLTSAITTLEKYQNAPATRLFAKLVGPEPPQSSDRRNWR
jgi:hypothetical protein